jgi:uncharacterized membrane-anchored protein
MVEKWLNVIDRGTVHVKEQKLSQTRSDAESVRLTLCFRGFDSASDLVPELRLR